MEKNSIVQRLPRLNGKATGCVVSFEKSVFPRKDHEHIVWRTSVERAAFATENDVRVSQKDSKELQT